VAVTLGWGVGGRLARWAISVVTTLGAGYLVAGRWSVPWLWAALGVASLGTLVLSLTIDPGLAAERRRPGPGAIDRGTQLAMSILMGAALIVAALDVGRRHWSDAVPLGAHVTALALFALGYGLVTWAVTVNRFFSGVVRLQSDRGQEVVTAGPYRWVRHPGYLGMLVAYPMLVLAIGSWWGFALAVACVPLVVRRLLLEDRYLQEHLAGYRAYAAQVPQRLIPGVW
jgi:protein-S-isoprenylcysteine O-methyltransferase Ste14